MRQRFALAAFAALAIHCGVTRSVMAQGAERDPVNWSGDPSALVPVGELERAAATPSALPNLLTAPSERAGLYWTLGNPAALPFELEDSYTRFRAQLTDENGDYRRPLDPTSARALDVSASGWRPIGARGAVSGGVAVRRSSMGSITADVGEPFSMSPHLFVDTSASSLGRTGARLDGAGGWRVGGWGFGAAIGYESWSTRTSVATVPRFQRGVLPAATVGIARRVGPLLLGMHARWQTEAQSLSLSARNTTTLVYTLAGYTEPVRVDITPSSGFFRRIERDAAAAGLGASLQTGGARWVAFGELTRLNEKQSWENMNDPDLDRWDATGHVLGLSTEAPLGDRARLVAGARWTRVSGEAVRAGLEDEGILFDATHDAVDVGMDLRLQFGTGWNTGARVAVGYDEDARNDALARVGSMLRTWRPSFAVEGAYDVTGVLALSVGAGVSWRTPSGSVPNPNALGDAYREWLAPELSYYGTSGMTHALRFAALWRTGAGTGFALDVQYAGAAPRRGRTQLPLSPTGDRRGWGVAISVIR